MPKYKVGDKVVVRSDLDPNGDILYCMDDSGEYSVYFIDEMQNDYAGRTVTISRIDTFGRYHIMEDVDMYTWVDLFFEGLESEVECQMHVVDEEDLLSIIT